MPEVPDVSDADAAMRSTHEELVGLLGTEGLGTVLAALDGSIGTDREAFERAVASGTMPDIAALAHRMKGGFSSLGAVRLTAMLKEVELAARASDGSTVEQWAPQALTELERVLGIIDREWRAA